MFTLMWRLYELTGDVAFVQTLYHANERSLEALPYDIFAPDPAAIQRGVREVIRSEGPTLRLGSVNKQQWHIALLRSGEAENGRVLWLDYATTV